MFASVGQNNGGTPSVGQPSLDMQALQNELGAT
jgi:hypothetical protein